MYIDERREYTEIPRVERVPRALPKGTLENECWYFHVLTNLSQCTDIIQFLKVCISLVIFSSISWDVTSKACTQSCAHPLAKLTPSQSTPLVK